jgi:hypothetical protein
MIEAQHVSKHYGRAVAVDDVSFVVQPGRMTGFLATACGSRTERRRSAPEPAIRDRSPPSIWAHVLGHGSAPPSAGAGGSPSGAAPDGGADSPNRVDADDVGPARS